MDWAWGTRAWQRWREERRASSCAYSIEREIERLKPPGHRLLLPWLSMGIGPTADIANGRVPLPWLAGTGLAAFAVVYVGCVLAAFHPPYSDGPAAHRLLAVLVAIEYVLAIVFGHNFVLLFVPVSLCCGTIARGRRFAMLLLALAGSAGFIDGYHGNGFWDCATIAYSTFISGLVIAAVLTLHEAVAKLRETRQQLARNAVAEERLRFARDLHDLLGHTMSVIVVKAEAVRRLAPIDLDAALGQAADIESVGRQALAEIREAVTGYREAGLTTELDRARSALSASGIEAVVRESGPPLPPQAEALFGWVVREGVTNVVRHSRASSCLVEVRTGGGRALLEITDNGTGPGTPDGSGKAAGGTGLKGLTERLAAAGGTLTAGPAGRRGFRLSAQLPVERLEPVNASAERTGREQMA
ncbi:sensor histidine kinase [Streptomyces sp. RB6PN25]|uniref:Sensor histidine kinase n=1 Tax=Streptomyces humicola TaxID=2953240 RepID=A0ABT1PWU4_9ACTN|nr:sensor histidine kinase [Streptomyces humicola]MCQ4082142.1 sensor histidine kinase [Streptomyces humicola]